VTTLIEAGYVGEEVEKVLLKLLQNHDPKQESSSLTGDGSGKGT
jgi:ATP-dependent protease Clp ATPase subunit